MTNDDIGSDLSPKEALETIKTMLSTETRVKEVVNTLKSWADNNEDLFNETVVDEETKS